MSPKESVVIARFSILHVIMYKCSLFRLYIALCRFTLVFAVFLLYGYWLKLLLVFVLFRFLNDCRFDKLHLLRALSDVASSRPAIVAVAFTIISTCSYEYHWTLCTPDTHFLRNLQDPRIPTSLSNHPLLYRFDSSGISIVTS